MKITKIAICFLLVVCSLLTAGCSGDSRGITGLDIIMSSQIELFAGEITEDIIVRVASSSAWNSTDVNIVVADESVVRIEHIKDPIDKNAIKFNIKGLKEGVTNFFFETTDGKVRSKVVTVIVGPAYTSIELGNDEEVIIRGLAEITDISFVVMRGNESIKCPADVQVISETAEVAEIVYKGTVDGKETCSIIPRSQGETYVYLRSSDGEIKSEKVKVIIIHGEGEDPIYFVLNTGTKKIHQHDCYTLKKIDSENKQGVWGSIDSYLDAGYKKCANCFDVPKEEVEEK